MDRTDWEPLFSVDYPMALAVLPLFCRANCQWGDRQTASRFKGRFGGWQLCGELEKLTTPTVNW